MSSYKVFAMTFALGMTPLALSCATVRTTGDGPIISSGTVENNEPDYGEQGNDFMAWCRWQQQQAQSEADNLKARAGNLVPDYILEGFNRVEIALDDALSMAGLRQLTHPDPGMREAGKVCERETSELSSRLWLDPALYQAVARVNPADPSLDPDQARYAAKVLEDFTRNGVNLEADTRQEIARLNQEITGLIQRFDENLSKDVRTVYVNDVKELEGMPQDFIDAHPKDDQGRIAITTNWPDYQPVMTYARNGALRRELYMAAMNLGYPDNKPVFTDLLKARHRLAAILGHPNFAHYNTEQMMVKSPEKARQFLDQVAGVARTFSDRDLKELLAAKQKDDPAAAAVYPWDRGYYSRLVTQERYAYDPGEAREYFPVDRVVDGVLDWSARLYGIRFTPAVSLPVWHPSVTAYRVTQGETPLGVIYLDLFPRDDKYKYFAMFTMTRGVENLRLPQGAIVGNFPDPSVADHALMSHEDVITFFHEFGHLMHHILSGGQLFARFSGTATEWDFVEVPSQLMEALGFEYDVLKTFAVNPQGQVIPQDLVDRLRKANHFATGLFAMQQLYYSALSLGVYSQDPATLDIDAWADGVQPVYSPYPVVEGAHIMEGFGHLTGYASNYYTYLWSLVIVKDLEAAIQAQGITSPEVWTAYRKVVLEPGGSRDAADLVRQFLNRDSNFDAFAAWLAGD